MLANSFNLENFKRHFRQTIPKPSGMLDETENVGKLWTLYALLPYIQFFDGIMTGEGQSKNSPASKLSIWARETNRARTRERGDPRCRVSSPVSHVRVLEEIPQMESLLAGLAGNRKA